MVHRTLQIERRAQELGRIGWPPNQVLDCSKTLRCGATVTPESAGRDARVGPLHELRAIRP